MGAKTRALLEYQEIELQIVDIKRQLARKQRQVDAQAKKLDTVKQANSGENGELRRAQMQIDELDVELKARSGHVAKLREHLNSVKTNKEYAAVLSQLNNENADLRKIEARGLELMQALEERKKAMGSRLENEKLEVDRLAALQAEFDQTKALFAERLAELETQRAQAASAIEKKILETFHRLSDRYEGEAMAECTRVNPRRDDFSCGGCNMSLTTDMANALRVRDEALICKNCGRLLYIKD